MTISLNDGGGRRKILFLTGTRADFGKLKPLIRAVEHSDGFEYGVFATGMHMLSHYGSTIHELEKAGIKNIFPFINQDSAVNSQMDFVLANTVQGFGHYIREFAADLIVVHGDRIEALAGAIVGALNNVLVAHIEGGEVSGTIDELLRHAITKLSHLHFVANEQARQRLLQMGEADECTFVIGSPEIDVMLSDELPTVDEMRRRYSIPFDGYGVFIYHPVTTELGRLQAHAASSVDALLRSGMNWIIIYPNNDHGSEIILAEYERLQGLPKFRMIPSMRFEYFLTALRAAVVIAGNSSAAIREAPVYGVPTVNIGTRQQNRFAYASILDVPEDTDAILDALGKLPRGVEPSMHFGRGESATLFLEHLRAQRLWQTPKQKQFRDLYGVASIGSEPVTVVSP